MSSHEHVTTFTSFVQSHPWPVQYDLSLVKHGIPKKHTVQSNQSYNLQHHKIL
jgi:hypothetical protein